MPVLPGLLRDIVHSDSIASHYGVLLALYALMQFLCAPVLGALSDRFGRRPVLLASLLGATIDYAIMATTPVLWILYAGRIVAGITGATGAVAGAYIADITPKEKRAQRFGLIGAAVGLGFIIGPAVGGLLGELGPRVPFYAAAAVSGVNLIYGFFVLPETLVPQHRRAFDWRRANPFGAVKVFRSYPGVVPLCAVMALFFFFTSVYPALWPFWGKANFGWSEAMVGLTLAFFGVVMAVAHGGPITVILQYLLGVPMEERYPSFTVPNATMSRLQWRADLGRFCLITAGA